MEQSSAARHMTESKHTPSCENQQYIQTPVELRKLTEDIMDKDFSGFRDERGIMRRLINIERELGYMKEVMSSLMDKQDRLTAENTELKLRLVKCEKVSAINQGLKEEIQEIKKQNDVLKATCQDYENSLRNLQVKVQNGIVDRVEDGLSENKLKELRNAWKQEQEEEKVKFTEVVKIQIQENTKVTVIQVIKEKDLVRDTVDKRKSFVIFGMKEKKNPNKFTREREKRELAKTIIKQVQDSMQELDQEMEEVIRLRRYSEGGRRPMKVKMRSQVAVEEIMARKEKLAYDTEHKDIWIKRDMSLEERKKEKVLRSKAKEKK
ncbi:hypothetical protein E2C01_062400 [Portunus trituberculatus]|uniref:Uncharacterized protein n=1 Tax=Portunus trituberculatus TaxID=210409 RepID=A0A5B7HAZ9_PORTR|nr:hypothetical protein [Portunus trituberculatus]